MIIYLNLCNMRVFLELNTIIQLHNLILFKDENKFSKNIKISIFKPIFFLELEGKSLAEPKILQLELARLGLITSVSISIHDFQVNLFYC